ncbi:MAG: hypothetical protein P4L84_02235 [Isosphaeraceae bacterium]|nr:hypothetical protein [Isosphaeraceae bacterium]
MAETRRTGKGAYLTLNGNRVEVTSLKSNVTTEWAKSTDSSDYDATDDILFSSQQPGETHLEIDVEGNFDLATTSANVISLIRKGGLVPAVIYSSSTTTFATGNFNVESGSVNLTVPGATMYTFSCKLNSNGPYTLGGG